MNNWVFIGAAAASLEEQDSGNRFVGTKAGGQTTGSVSVTVDSGNNRVMVVSTSGDGRLTGLARDGQNFTSIGVLLHSFVQLEMWVLIAPNVGTFNLVGTAVSGVIIDFGGNTFNNADQTTPLTSEQTDTSSGTTSVTVSDTVATEDIFLSAVCIADFGAGVTSGVGQTEIWNNLSQGVFTGVMSYEQGDGGVVTSSYTFTFSDGACLGYTLNEF